MTTTLHLAARDMAALASGADGALVIDLSEEGEQTVVAAAARLLALEGLPPAERRAVWLRQLPDEDLVQLATARLGAPDAEVMAEVVRRMKALLERARPAFDAARKAGILPTS